MMRNMQGSALNIVFLKQSGDFKNKLHVQFLFDTAKCRFPLFLHLLIPTLDLLVDPDDPDADLN